MIRIENTRIIPILPSDDTKLPHFTTYTPTMIKAAFKGKRCFIKPVRLSYYKACELETIKSVANYRRTLKKLNK
jgi:hypothetical protein